MVLDAFYVPARYPNSHPEGAPFEHNGPLQNEEGIDHARRINGQRRCHLCSRALTPQGPAAPLQTSRGPALALPQLEALVILVPREAEGSKPMGREWILRIRRIDRLEQRLDGRIDRLEQRLDRRIDELEARVNTRFDHPTVSVGAMGTGGDFGSGSHGLATTD